MKITMLICYQMNCHEQEFVLVSSFKSITSSTRSRAACAMN